MPTDNDTPAPNSATLTIRGLPAGSREEQVLALANDAKACTWSWDLGDGKMPPDRVFIRAALAIMHMSTSSEVRQDASVHAAFLATSFSVTGTDPAEDARLLAMSLDRSKPFSPFGSVDEDDDYEFEDEDGWTPVRKDG